MDSLGFSVGTRLIERLTKDSPNENKDPTEGEGAGEGSSSPPVDRASIMYKVAGKLSVRQNSMDEQVISRIRANNALCDLVQDIRKALQEYRASGPHPAPNPIISQHNPEVDSQEY